MKQIALTGKLGKGKFSLVDDEDFDNLSKHQWYVTVYGYANCRDYIRGSGRKKQKSTTYIMHRLIMNCPEDKHIDHINHNTLDNRKSNLRIVTQSQNMMNSSSRKGSTSKYLGVGWHNQNHNWRAYIKSAQGYKHIGSFTDEKSAAMAYDRKALELYGEFANLNFSKERVV